MTTNQSRDIYSSLCQMTTIHSPQLTPRRAHQNLKVQLSQMESTAPKLGSFLLTPGGPGRACSPACACSTYHTYDTWTRGHCNSWMRLKIGTVPFSLGDQRAGITAKCRSYILEMVQGGTNAVIDLSDVFCSFDFSCHHVILVRKSCPTRLRFYWCSGFWVVMPWVIFLVKVVHDPDLETLAGFCKDRELQEGGKWRTTSILHPFECLIPYFPISDEFVRKLILLQDLVTFSQCGFVASYGLKTLCLHGSIYYIL